MKLEDLKPGTYVVREDTPNPYADRRTKHDWRLAATWPKGLRLVVTERPPIWEDSAGKVLEIFKEGGYSHQHLCIFQNPDGAKRPIESDQPQINALIPTLDPAVETVTSVISRLGYQSWDSPILDRLCKLGKINLADIEAAVMAERESGPEEPGYFEPAIIPG